jgi:dihydropteroate synthase
MWVHATGALSLDQPRLLGIINATPDSFSDGGRFFSVDDAMARAEELVAEGADVLDVGGESTRPQGAVAVGVEEELRRVLPVVEGIRRHWPSIPVSVDTVKSTVARAALDAGASIINDVSGFRLDPRMGEYCASAGAGVVLMHSRGDVADMATFAHATYRGDVVGEVVDELRMRVEAADAAGIARDRIVVDPGIGFAKRSEQSLAVLAGLERVAALGYPVLVGTSRKRFIGELTGVQSPDQRVAGTVASNVVALERGARLFRVHDVRPNREGLAVAWAIFQGRVAQ